jgi:hypothetical protein
MTKFKEEVIKVNGEEITYHKVDHDINGNPRYVTHFLNIGVEPKDYGKIPGLTKYRAKWFGGGYVFQSYNLEQDLEYALEKVQNFYKEDK